MLRWVVVNRHVSCTSSAYVAVWECCAMIVGKAVRARPPARHPACGCSSVAPAQWAGRCQTHAREGVTGSDAPAASHRHSGQARGQSTPVDCLRAEQELIPMQALGKSSDRASGSKLVGWEPPSSYAWRGGEDQRQDWRPAALGLTGPNGGLYGIAVWAIFATSAALLLAPSPIVCRAVSRCWMYSWCETVFLWSDRKIKMPSQVSNCIPHGLASIHIMHELYAVRTRRWSSLWLADKLSARRCDSESSGLLMAAGDDGRYVLAGRSATSCSSVSGTGGGHRAQACKSSTQVRQRQRLLLLLLGNYLPAIASHYLERTKKCPWDADIASTRDSSITAPTHATTN